MAENRVFPPEDMQAISHYTLSELKAAQSAESILSGSVLRCEENHDLIVSLGSLTGRIPRAEAVHCAISGAQREIAILSLVGKSVCFCVTDITVDEAGRPQVLLSRQMAQEKALRWMVTYLKPGMVVACRVTHLEPFGAFVDLGCGVISLLPIETLSVSRITHPSDRVRVGQRLLAVVTAVDQQEKRFHLSMKELLGTWLENASRFKAGETVRGIVRSIQSYGAFIELTPNLSGLAEPWPGLEIGDAVSVYIKHIQPERMKIKLQVIQRLPALHKPEPLQYQITDGQLTKWVYSPSNCQKPHIETVFNSCP